MLSDRRLVTKKKQLNNFAQARKYYTSGNEKYEARDYLGALADLNRSLELNPDSFCAYHKRARIKEALNDFAGAVNDYTLAIATDDEEIQYAYVNRGYLKEQQFKDYAGALADYNESIKIKPMEPSYARRGDLKANNFNDPQGALQDYTLAIELNPEYDCAYASRARLKKNVLKDDRGAILDYNYLRYATRTGNRVKPK
jgi:tetratricopeptide (TPR) repeat protein